LFSDESLISTVIQIDGKCSNLLSTCFSAVWNAGKEEREGGEGEKEGGEGRREGGREGGMEGGRSVTKYVQ